MVVRLRQHQQRRQRKDSSMIMITSWTMTMIVMVLIAVVASLSSSLSLGGPVTVMALSSSSTITTTPMRSSFATSPLFATTTSDVTSTSKSSSGGYEPKWKKKATMAEQIGNAASIGYDNVGLKGTIPVVFRTIQQSGGDKKKNKNKNKTNESEQQQQGGKGAPVVEEKMSMAWVGQPLRDVASQAGQYIQYGCGKGECGTCECMINGKWVRPCVDVVPADAAVTATATTPTTTTVHGASKQQQQQQSQIQPLIVQVKAVKAKSKSSGKFFSIKSFIMGFWNNLLGMVGFVKFRRAARKNWEERQAYEELVRVKTIEKRMARLAREAAAAAASAA